MVAMSFGGLVVASRCRSLTVGLLVCAGDFGELEQELCSELAGWDFGEPGLCGYEVVEVLFTDGPGLVCGAELAGYRVR